MDLFLRAYVASELVSIRVSGGEEEPALAVISNALGRREEQHGGFYYHDDEYPEIFHLYANEHVTIGELVGVFSDELTTEPATVRVILGPHGGDGVDFPQVLATLDKVMQVGGYFSAALATWKVAMRVKYSRTRALAKEWVDTDVLSMELEQAVRAVPLWYRGMYDRTFALSQDRGPLLLRTLGYWKVPDQSEETWLDASFGSMHDYHFRNDH